MIIFEILLFIAIFFLYLAIGKKITHIFKIPINNKTEELTYSLALSLFFMGMLIFILGHLGILYSWLVILITLILLIILRKDLLYFINFFWTVILNLKTKINLKSIKKYPLETFLISIIIVIFLLFVSVNLSPETEFDSLWYHLTQGKTYLLDHQINYYPIPSNLAPNTTMPRLIDLNYTFLLSFSNNDLPPRLLHLTLLLLSGYIIFAFAKKYFNYQVAIYSLLILATIHSVQWLAHTAYIDFGSLFFGSLSFYTFYNWLKSNDKKYLILTSYFTGLALTVKLWNLILLPLYSIFIIARKKWQDLLIFNFWSLIFVSPFFVESYYYTGNPIYPIFTISDKEHLAGANSPWEYFSKIYPKTFFTIIYQDYLLKGSFVILFPIVILIKDTYKKYLPLLIWGILFLLFWSLIPVHEIRYGLMGILPLIILSAFSLDRLFHINKYVKFISFLIFLIYLIFSTFVFYQTNKKFIPAPVTQAARTNLLKQEFSNNMWTFYDSSGFFSANIKETDRVMSFVHNSFYLDFSYFDGLRLISIFNNLQNQDELLNWLENEKYTYLLFRGPFDFNNDFLKNINKIDFDDVWLKEHFKIVFDDQNGLTKLYKINY